MATAGVKGLTVVVESDAFSSNSATHASHCDLVVLTTVTALLETVVCAHFTVCCDSVLPSVISVTPSLSVSVRISLSVCLEGCLNDRWKGMQCFFFIVCALIAETDDF